MSDYLKVAFAMILSGCCVCAGWEIRAWKDQVVEDSALASQAATLTSDCNDKLTLTKETNDELQKSNDLIAHKLAVAKRLHPSLCIPITSQLSNSTGSGNQHAGQNGIGSDWLRDFAAECEQYRSEVVTLVAFGQQQGKLVK